ncbi:MAG: EamA family transporter [Betaproteobacteria bacterium]|nr:EamA family transporter [Betaproteobacteria bacterium]
MTARVEQRRAAVVMAALSLVWGYAWITAKIGLAYCGPFDFAMLRVLVGVVSLGAILIATGRPLRPRHLGAAALVGCAQTSAFLIFNTWALADGGPGKTSIITFTMPFWVLLFAWPALGERLRGVQWAAVGVAVAGLIAILEPWRLQTSLLSKLTAVAAGISWAVGVILSKRLHNRERYDALEFTFWQMLVGLGPMCIAAWAIPQREIAWGGPLVLSLAFTGIVATGLGWFMWIYVLNRLPAGTTGLASLAVPVIAAATSAVQLGERLRPAELTGMVLIGSALAVMAWDSARRHERPDPMMGQE